MSRLTPLWESPRLHIRRFDHAHAHCDRDDDGVDEVATQYIASMVERGRFRLESAGASWELGPGDVMLSRPGMEFSVHHIDTDFSDVCLSVCFDTAQIVPDGLHLWPSDNTAVLRASDRLGYLHWGVMRAVDHDVALQAETCAQELLNEISGRRVAADKPFRANKLRWYAERVQAVRERLDSRLEEDHRLDALAAGVGMSAFNFARVFQRLVGQPPHAYLLQRRLQAATAMLQQGSSVTDACLACGFNSPGHFGRLFQREFGRLPSAFRREQAARIDLQQKPARNCKRGNSCDH
jgi:AraC-like DNA-binding protein